MGTLDYQQASRSSKIPSKNQFQRWVDAVLMSEAETLAVLIRVIDEAEMTDLNQRYRGKSGASNVLSFPAQAVPGFVAVCLGDVLFCAPVIEQEAEQQQKALNHHWAHLTVHGILHLLGYDHANAAQAAVMEGKEIKILKTMKISNPYAGENL